MDAIYLDFQKAFDSVPHHRLIRKLAAYGVTGKILRWIETFLTDRKQRVCVEGSLSNWEDVLSGIPQGSVLGPTLFVMFINDMPDAITSLSKMFADDAKVFRQIENRADIAALQKDLDHLTDWSLKWQMNFNIKKCKRLHIGQTNPGSNDLSLHVVELSGNNRCQQIEINTYPDSPLFISTGFLPRVSSKRLN